MTEIKTLSARDYVQCGTALRQKRRFAAAIACFERAVELEPDEAAWHFLLGNTWLVSGDGWWRGEHHLVTALRLDPDMHAAVHDIGMCRLEAGDLVAAAAYFRCAMSLAPDAHESHLDLALTQLMAGQWPEGFEHYDARLDLLPEQYAKPKGMSLWRGEDLAGCTLYVTAEQGIGDTIMFARFLAWASTRCRKLIFDIQPELFGLFSRYGAICELRPKGEPVPKGGYWTPLCSIPRWHKTTVGTVPPDPGYLRALALEVAGARGLTVPECPWKPLKIGLCWSGNPAHGHDHERSIALDHFLPLMGTRRRQFYSFQVGHRARDLDLAGAAPLIYDLSPGLHSWEVTAAALLQMDLVISVDTAIAHLAAAMNIPTWLIVGRTPDWRWMRKRTDSPWYDSVHVLRANNGWADLVLDLGAALDKYDATEARP